MSLLDKIVSIFSGGGGGQHYIVDGARLVDERNGSRLGPREQINVMNQLARFAQQEKIRVSVVFEGKVLREVEGDGGEFKGLTVYFVENEAALKERLGKLARSGVTVVTAAVNEEIARSRGARVIRASTFRKALESQGGGNGGERDRERGRDRGGRDRDRDRRRQRPPRPNRPESGGGQSDNGGGEADENEPVGDERGRREDNDTVRNLIDLVDEPPPRPAPPAVQPQSTAAGAPPAASAPASPPVSPPAGAPDA